MGSLPHFLIFEAQEHEDGLGNFAGVLVECMLEVLVRTHLIILLGSFRRVCAHVCMYVCAGRQAGRCVCMGIGRQCVSKRVQCVHFPFFGNLKLNISRQAQFVMIKLKWD